MKFYLFVAIILSISTFGFSQTQKFYIDANKHLSTDSSKGVSYVSIEKVNESDYFISNYEMSGVPILKGHYKDLTMKIPNGKFVYYSKIIGNRKYFNTDSFFFAKQTGYYKNGLKTGTWISYFRVGVKRDSVNYENNLLNGPCKYYEINTGKVDYEGIYLKGQMDGQWNQYQRDEANPIFSQFYTNGKLIKTIYHTKKPKVPDGFDGYIESNLKQYIDTLKDKGIVVTFSVTEKGRIVSLIKVNKPLSDEYIIAIKYVLFNAPDFQPALHDDMPIRQIYYYNFSFGAYAPNENKK